MHYKKDGKNYNLDNALEWQGRYDEKKSTYGNKYRTHRNYGDAGLGKGFSEEKKKQYDKWYYENVRKNNSKGINRDKNSRPGTKGQSKRVFFKYLNKQLEDQG